MLVLALLATPLPVHGADEEAPASPPARTLTRTLVLGPADAQRDDGGSTLGLPFATRADEDPTGGRVHVRIARTRAGTGRVAAIEVLVNETLVGRFDVAPGTDRTFTIPPDALAPRNLLAVRALDPGGQPVAPSDGWGLLEPIELQVDTTPAALPNDLALLPLPFVDRDFDREAGIEIIVPSATPANVRLASLVASWIALDAPVPLSFSVRAGALPAGRAVVLVASDEQQRQLGLAPLHGPAVRMVDHPGLPAGNVKLLVVGGSSPAQLRVAAEALAVRSERLVSSEARLDPPPSSPAAAPYSAPRWLPSGRLVHFREFPLGGMPAHDGTSPTTLSVRFRIAPDLAIWPADSVRLDLEWSQRLPRGVAPPRLDVELNGSFLTTLARPLGPGDHTGRVELRIPRQRLRGFNELLVHVQYPDAARALGAGDEARVAISGSSALHLERLGHFLPLPDVATFTDDGFPFTRLPDLGETTIVLPAQPRPDESSAVVTALAQFAQVTGKAPTRAAVVPATAPDRDLANRDLLVVGTPQDNALLARWHDRWPVELTDRGARVQRPEARRLALELSGGPGPLLDARRANEVLDHSAELGVVMGTESPLTRGRVVMALTAPERSPVPPYRRFLGFAKSRVLTGNDLLLVSGEHRSMFRIGPSFDRGRLAPWRRAQWFLASHWILLVPLLGLGVALLARSSASAISARVRARLAEGSS